MKRTVWVVGGGSGMGRSSALEAARYGWSVVVSGRRSAQLEQVREEIVALGAEAWAIPLDVQDQDAVERATRRVIDEAGRLDALVVAAGLNHPKRRWADLSVSAADDIIQTNLTGVINTMDASLPALRSAAGQIVIISSYAGWQFQPGAGVAYSASKAGLKSLSMSLNHDEAESGVRCCLVCPGDVATDFLEQRPVVPGEDARAMMLTADDIGRTVGFVLESPSHVRIDELVISPVSQIP